MSSQLPSSADCDSPSKSSLFLPEEFGDWVIDRFVGDYMDGRTPNPCVLCNTHIKWDALLRRADQLGCEFIATGHVCGHLLSFTSVSS